MTTEAPTPIPVVLGPGALSDEVAEAMLGDGVAAEAECSVIEMTGPNVVDCVQGLLTNDVTVARVFAYGAFLTVKGMIVSDLWVARHGSDATLYAPIEGSSAVLNTLKRSVPPRLASYEDVSQRVRVLRVMGHDVYDRLASAGIVIPERGRGEQDALDGVAYSVHRPPLEEPFALQLACVAEGAGVLWKALEAAGLLRADGAALEVTRVLASWPRLGVEIDSKTLPQEAGFDKLNGVSYTKGCYTGQETVARVHFRGHPNRWLCRLAWTEPPRPDDSTVTHAGRNAGRVTSAVWHSSEQEWIGLGMVRREVEHGSVVTAAGAEAQAFDLHPGPMLD